MKIKKEIDEDLKILAKGTSISFVFGVIRYVITFLFKLFSARYFEPEKYGLFEALNTVFLIAMVFAVVGIPSGITRYIPIYKNSQKNELLKGYLKFIFGVPLLCSIFIAVVLFLFSQKITDFFNFNPEFSGYLKLMAFFIPLKAMSQIIRKIFVAEKKIFIKSLSNDFLENIILLIGIFSIIFWKLNFIWIIYFFIASIIFTFIFDWIFYLNKIKLNTSQKEEMKTREWLNFSIPLFFTGIFAFILQWIDNIVVGKVMNSYSLGIYSIAFSLGAFIVFFQIMFLSIFNPLISEKHILGEKEKISLLFKKAASWAFGMGFFVFTFFAIEGKRLLVIFYGKEYESGYFSLVIISFGFLFFVSIGLNESLLILHKKTKFIFKISILCALINLILNIFLVEKIGILGAAISSSISFSLIGLLAFLMARKIEKLQFDFNKNIKAFFSGIITVFIILLLRYLGESPLSLVFSIFFSFLVYLILLFIFGFIDKDDRKIVSNLLIR